MQAGFEQAARDRKVLCGRHHHARGLDPSCQRAGIAQGLDPEPGREGFRRLGVAIDHRDQLGIGQRGIFLSVIAAEMTAADHGRPDRGHRAAIRRQRCGQPRASTAATLLQGINSG
jgi:hypothetical protein